MFNSTNHNFSEPQRNHATDNWNDCLHRKYSSKDSILDIRRFNHYGFMFTYAGIFSIAQQWNDQAGKQKERKREKLKIIEKNGNRASGRFLGRREEGKAIELMSIIDYLIFILGPSRPMSEKS